MSTHQHIDRVCAAAMALCLLAALLFMNGAALGIQPSTRAMGYEAKLFDTSRVHTIDIIMDDWDAFLETCENEEYAPCSVVIDGEACKNTAIRAKGNTSLSTVSRLGSDRYSFKLEFGHYDSGRTYYGLDKLCLNNVIQDNTYMKDYLAYQLMGAFGVNAPLCSYAYLTVNGQDWGLYLAAEGVEDSFLQRNYGRDHGQLYKPDSMSFGGGRGNGRDFDMDGFLDRDGGQGGSMRRPAQQGDMQVGLGPAGQAPDGDAGAPQQGPGPSASGNAPPEGFDPSAMFGEGENGGRRGGFGGMSGGMGSGDVKLQYSDDNPDSYSNIFDSAKTSTSEADQARLIQALKALGAGEVETALDIDQVLRYFAVHNFVVNGDSYTGSMVHNYYLYEQNGRLAMIPWDYNLAFGTFQGGNASGAVNDPIDSPLSVSGDGSRPMADWIFSSEEYTQLYHQYLRQLLDSVDCSAIIEQAYALIAPYVERDPTKFCTCEEFEAGVDALKRFCALRAESVSGQLDGSIPSTDAGQTADRSALVDASGLTLSDMGTMNSGGFGGPGGEGGARPDEGEPPAWDSGADGQPSGPMGMPGGFPGGGGDAAWSGGFPGGGPEGTAPGGTSGQPPAAAGPEPAALALAGASVLALLAGLAAASRFQRRRAPRRKRAPAPLGAVPRP